MFDRLFTFACNATYIPGLLGALNSIYAYHGSRIPVFIYECDFSTEELAQVDAHPVSPLVFPIDCLPNTAPVFGRRSSR